MAAAALGSCRHAPTSVSSILPSTESRLAQSSNQAQARGRGAFRARHVALRQSCCARIGEAWRRRREFAGRSSQPAAPWWHRRAMPSASSVRGKIAAHGDGGGGSGGGDPVREWLLGEGGAGAVTRVTPVGGGCINAAYRYDTDAGPFFVKQSRSAGPAMFKAEARGLEAMHATGAIRVPKPLKVGELPFRGSFIIMEFVEFGPSRGGQAALGRQLAEMHKAGTTDKGFGFDVDNTIGSTEQVNPWTPDWPVFFRDSRLGFQLSLIRQQYGDGALVEKGQKLLAKLPALFEGLEIRPCLLHGDLWSGNVAADRDGRPVILDPATYYGHNEAEFGMSWCAGFGPAFYDAYFEVMPKRPGFEERVELYKLYHYLNHYNLFGSGYRSSCMLIIERFI